MSLLRWADELVSGRDVVAVPNTSPLYQGGSTCGCAYSHFPFSIAITTFLANGFSMPLYVLC